MRKYFVLYLLAFIVLYAFAMTGENKQKIEDLKQQQKRLENEIKVKTDSLEAIKSNILKIENEEALTFTENGFEYKIEASRTGQIKQNPSYSADVIYEYKRGDVLTFIGYTSGYWNVKINDVVGFTLDFRWIIPDELKKIKQKIVKYEIKKKKKQKLEKDKLNSAIVLEQKKNEFEKYKYMSKKNTGMWSVKNFVDDFGDKTDSKYITAKEQILGKFSNSATQNSKLAVSLLVQPIYNKGEKFNNVPSISIFLYEYAGNNPVKAYSKEFYTIHLKYNKNERNILYASNSSDRITLDAKNSKKLHDILKLGGKVKFLFSTHTFYIK